MDDQIVVVLGSRRRHPDLNAFARPVSRRSADGQRKSVAGDTFDACALPVYSSCPCCCAVPGKRRRVYIDRSHRRVCSACLKERYGANRSGKHKSDGVYPSPLKSKIASSLCIHFRALSLKCFHCRWGTGSRRSLFSTT